MEQAGIESVFPIADIIRAAKGELLEELAAALTSTPAGRSAAAAGIARYRKDRKRVEKLRTKIRSLTDAGMTHAEVAKRLKVCVRTVGRYSQGEDEATQ